VLAGSGLALRPTSFASPRLARSKEGPISFHFVSIDSFLRLSATSRPTEIARRQPRSVLQRLLYAGDAVSALEERYRAVVQAAEARGAGGGSVGDAKLESIGAKVGLKARQVRRLLDKVDDGQSLVRKPGSGFFS
jgi:hypothetical protein